MRKYSLADTLIGSLRSLLHGTGMNPAAGMKEIAAVHDERMRRERNNAFGNGQIGGDQRNWQPPFHATTKDGRPVTVSFGKGSRTGNTLICDGHVDFSTFYGNRSLQIVKGHDHFLNDGSYGANRGKYNG